jgi:chemotaxis protein MotA
MDLMTLLGTACGFGAIYFVLWHNDMVHFLLNLEAIVLIFGGTLGSVLISYPYVVLKRIPLALKWAVFPPPEVEAPTLVRILVDLSEKARKVGPESLKGSTNNFPHPFLYDAVDMLADGLEPQTVQEKMSRDIVLTRLRHSQMIQIFRSAGTYSPIFGLLGTLIGVVSVLRNITNPAEMGSSMAIAMTASFYGIFAANFFFLPVAAKVNYHMEQELLAKEIIQKGVQAIQAGEVPWVVFKRLETFLAYKSRKAEAARLRR